MNEMNEMKEMKEVRGPSIPSYYFFAYSLNVFRHFVDGRLLLRSLLRFDADGEDCDHVPGDREGLSGRFLLEVPYLHGRPGTGYPGRKPGTPSCVCACVWRAVAT